MSRLLRLYLAAPLFNEAERRRNRELRDTLSEVAEVFLPQEDGSLLTELVAHGYSPADAKRHVFVADLRAIEHADMLVIVMDGRVIDEGACFELGYAFALGKACVGVKSDSRTLLALGDNPMIECALKTVFENDRQLYTFIKSFSHSDHRNLTHPVRGRDL